MPFTGSWMHLYSRVPTVVEGSSGVKRKWFLGDIIVALNLALFKVFANIKPPHPEPMMIVLGLPL